MRLPRHDAVPGGEDPYSEFCRLAKEFRVRQKLANSSAQKNITNPAPTSQAEKPIVRAGAIVQLEDIPEVLTQQGRLPIDPTEFKDMPSLTGPSARLSRGGRCPKAKPGRGRKNARNTDTSQPRRNKSPRHPATGAKGWEYGESGGKLNPYTEAAMLRAFGNTKSRGVSVSAIRSLYRKRHDEEKAKAMDEVRRWWRCRRSEATPLAEATVAAALMLASCKEGNDQARRSCVSGDPGKDSCVENITTVGTLRGHCALQNDGFGDSTRTATFGRAFSSNGSCKANEAASQLIQRKSRSCNSMRKGTEDDEDAYYCVFDDLDWRRVLQDHSHAAGLVRDIKQMLRAGQPVKTRAQEDQSFSQSSSADVQLMLRMLYMQCVRVRYNKGP